MQDWHPIIDFIRTMFPNRDFIPLHAPYFGGNEKKYLIDCIDSTFVSSVGKYVDRFEELIREFTGAKYAIAAVNGTAALHIALKLAGVEQGDLVITQPLTFIATCNAISYCGADPVFVDVDRDTLGMSPDSLEEWLHDNTVVEHGSCFYLSQINTNQKTRMTTNGAEEVDLMSSSFKSADSSEADKRTGSSASNKSLVSNSDTLLEDISIKKKIAACVPMHTFGHPCEIDRIVEICNKYHIPVVEDAAESIGSYYHGQHTGTFGKLGILSFNGNKTITTGGGGMIITNDVELGTMAKYITTTAKKPHPWKFEHDLVGYNYRLPNINAALGCAQMELLPQILQSKRELADSYQKFFTDRHDISFVSEPHHSISNYWLNAILLQDEIERDAFLKVTNESGIMTRPAWILMNKLSMFSGAIRGNLTQAESLEACLVNIPSSSRLNMDSNAHV